MIARITGFLTSVSPQRAILTPLGPLGDAIAYEVLIPTYLSIRLGGIDLPSQEPITLCTMHYLEGVGQGTSFIPRLIGFASEREVEFFDLLTSVKGLGNKRALRALAVNPGTVARAIVDRDHRFLQTLPEIGPKLAELIVHELRTKADAFLALADAPVATTPAPEPKPTKPARVSKPANGTAPKPAAKPPEPARIPIRETVAALITLGETPIDAERMVARAIDKARAAQSPIPATPDALLNAAFAAR